MRLLLILTIFTSLVCVQYVTPDSADGQVLGKTLHDYWLDKPFTYRPNDPWVRGKAFQIQTGHYGRFYNCDDEECKRNSPYICWKTHYENDIPPRRGFWGGIKQDWSRVTQRIRDGACLSDDGSCASCENPAGPQAQTCTCQECLQEKLKAGQQFAAKPPLYAPRKTAKRTEITKRNFITSLTNLHRSDSKAYQKSAQSTPHLTTPKFGLVSGSTLNGTGSSVRPAPVIENFSAPTARVARIAKPLSRKE